MRIRSIKPGFFTNDILAEVEPLGRLLFAGLWCLADREGRLEDRPRRIKAEVLPYDECDIDALLASLAARGFIHRYEVDGAAYIQITTFSEHQYPNAHEAKSKIPPPHDACIVHAQPKSDARTSLMGMDNGNKNGKGERENARAGVNASTAVAADAASLSPSLSVALQPTEPEPESPTPEAAIHAACVEALGHGPPTTEKRRRKWRSGIADLARQGATPEHIPKLVAAYHAQFNRNGDGIPCEPWNLADHYPELEQETSHGTDQPRGPAHHQASPEERAQRDEARAEAKRASITALAAELAAGQSGAVPPVPRTHPTPVDRLRHAAP